MKYKSKWRCHINRPWTCSWSLSQGAFGAAGLLWEHLQDKQQKPVVLQHQTVCSVMKMSVWVLTVKPLCGFMNLNMRVGGGCGCGPYFACSSCVLENRSDAATCRAAGGRWSQDDKMQSLRANLHRFYTAEQTSQLLRLRTHRRLKLQSNDDSSLNTKSSHSSVQQEITETC